MCIRDSHKTTPKENLSCDAGQGKHAVPHGMARPRQALTRGTVVLHCWLACRANFVWHERATRHGVPMLDPKCFRTTLCELFCGFKLASLALISSKYRSSFHFLDKVPENTKRCYMSKIYAKGGRFDHFLT